MVCRGPNVEFLDKRTGALVGEFKIPGHPMPVQSLSNGAPMTYMHQDRQYIVVNLGGASSPAEFVALALPE